MQLHGGEPQRIHRLGDGGGLGIAKHPDVRERRTRHHGAGGGNVHVARAFRHKDEAAEHGARLMGGGGVLGTGQAAHLVLAEHELAHRGLQIRLRHEGRSHQEALGVVAQGRHLGAVVDAGFADHHPIPRDPGRQLLSAGKIDAQIPQIPVVDANHRGAEVDGAGQLLLVAHLGEHPQAQFFRHFEQGAIPLVGEHGEHQEDGVRLIVAGQIDLIGVNHEVLAEHRLLDAAPYPGQEGEIPLEELLVRQHRDGGGVVAIDVGDGLRAEVIADQALGGGGLLALQNEAGGALAQIPLEVPIARGQRVLEARQGLALLAGGDPLLLGRHDLAENGLADGGHVQKGVGSNDI